MKKISKEYRNELIFYICLLIVPIINVVIFYFGVNGASIIMAFQEYDPITYSYNFNGLNTLSAAFENMFLGKNGMWGSMFGLSIASYLLGEVTKTPLYLIFSYFIYKYGRIGGYFKLLLFLPSMIATMANVVLFTNFMDSGVTSFFNKYFNINLSGFFRDTQSRAFWTIYLYGFWCGFGSSLLMYVNAMNAISESISEAASMDGCGFFREFFSITFPLTFSTWKTLFTIGLTGIFSGQLMCFEIYGVNPYFTKMQTIGYYLFRETITGGQSSYPILSAYGIFLTLIIVPIIVIMQKIINKLDPLEN